MKTKLLQLAFLWLNTLTSLRTIAGEIHFQRAIAALRDGGATRIFVGEQHSDPTKLHTAMNTLVGATSGGRKISFWREMNLGDIQHIPEFERYMAQHNTNLPNDLGGASHILVHVMANLLVNEENPTFSLHEAASSYLQSHPYVNRILQNGTTSLDAFYFTHPDRRDLGRHLKQPGFSIASLGLDHAIATFTKPGHRTYPWRANGEYPDLEYPSPTFSTSAQKDMWNGYQKALASGPDLLVVNTDAAFSVEADRRLFLAQFLSQGFGILRIPMTTSAVPVANIKRMSYTVDIFAPCELLPAMRKIHTKYRIDGATLKAPEGNQCGVAKEIGHGNL
jgi:hypothetical protein